MTSTLLINGNALHIPLADQSVHMVCCSPPYWGLRDYGLARWEGGDEGCDHLRPIRPRSERPNITGSGIGKGGATSAAQDNAAYKDICDRCGAIRHDAGIGLEQTPDEYVAKMVQVFREVWRVLRDDGVVFLNMGDSYANAQPRGHFGDQGETSTGAHGEKIPARDWSCWNLKQKDLVGMPWRLAFALQADGWYLRSDIIWAKPNPMPESVTDRPTKAHEYVFLLTKNKRYFYDQEAIKEKANTLPHAPGWKNSPMTPTGPMAIRAVSSASRIFAKDGSRNRRTVWTIATAPYSGAHFATFPPKLIEPMIKAGTSERGCCPECGKQWERVTERGPVVSTDGSKPRGNKSGQRLVNDWNQGEKEYGPNQARMTTTLGFSPTCSHDHTPIPATVLDPFVGSGTTMQVARALGRRGIGIDLSAEYLQLARQRLGLDKLDDWGKGITDEAEYEGLPLFGNSV